MNVPKIHDFECLANFCFPSLSTRRSRHVGKKVSSVTLESDEMIKWLDDRSRVVFVILHDGKNLYSAIFGQAQAHQLNYKLPLIKRDIVKTIVSYHQDSPVH